MKKIIYFMTNGVENVDPYGERKDIFLQKVKNGDIVEKIKKGKEIWNIEDMKTWLKTNHIAGMEVTEVEFWGSADEDLVRVELEYAGHRWDILEELAEKHDEVCVTLGIYYERSILSIQVSCETRELREYLKKEGKNVFQD